MFKQILIYFLNFIQVLLFVLSIPMLLFPVIAVIIYFNSKKDVNLRFSFINAAYPWTLLETPSQFFMFAGIVFFIGLASFVLSYFTGKIILKLKG